MLSFDPETRPTPSADRQPRAPASSAAREVTRTRAPRASASEILARRDRLRSTRGVWESHWQEIADRILPRQGSFTTRFQIVGAFAMIAAITANETDDKVVNAILKVINLLGMNIGTARNDPNVGVNRSNAPQS